MSLLTLLPVEAHEELAELVLPTWAFPAIAAGIFLFLAIVTWSYRDVAHRHSDKTSADASSHQDAHH
ncbi:MAG TPA: hypothetical protein VNS80_07525 [Pseudolysinimonas sp.]|nr:hypothetical protein [Pseudolysinimonas sp.]